MSKFFKVILIIFILLCFCINSVLATNTSSNTTTSSTTSSSQSTTTVTTLDSVSDSNPVLTIISDVCTILLIPIGVVIIFLAIAILIRLR